MGTLVPYYDIHYVYRLFVFKIFWYDFEYFCKNFNYECCVPFNVANGALEQDFEMIILNLVLQA